MRYDSPGYGEWSPEADAEWNRLYAIHNNGDRDEMMRILIEEKLQLEKRIAALKKLAADPSHPVWR